MKVLKRNGEVQDFNSLKILTTIENTARDCNNLLNESDINLLRQIIMSKLSSLSKKDKNRIISSFEIKMIIYESLKDLGFSKIANVYINN